MKPGRILLTQAQIRAGLAFVGDEPPVIVDWLPWNHTFGSNHNFNLVLDNGGSLYIDEGKPLPGAIETTVRNLRLIDTRLGRKTPKLNQEISQCQGDDRHERKY